MSTHIGRRFAALGTLVVAAMLLSGCISSLGAPDARPTGGASSPEAGELLDEIEGQGESTTPRNGEPATGATAVAVEMLHERYEHVRDGDYEAACALYSPTFAKEFIALVGPASLSCVAAHEKGVAEAEEYLATAKKQGRLGLTPFFYVPSGIDVDTSLIFSDSDDEATIAGGAVVSTDTREFEDGVGETPNWLTGQVTVARGDDGVWRFVSAVE